MGIDIYMKWDGMTKEEKESQYTGFEVSGKAGAVGYLRESYGSEPYATHVLVPEAFDNESWEENDYYVPFQTHILEARLENAVETAHERGRNYGMESHSNMEEALRNFVKLAREKEDEGKKISIHASY